MVSSRQHLRLLNLCAPSSDEMLIALIEDHLRLVDGGLGSGRVIQSSKERRPVGLGRAGGRHVLVCRHCGCETQCANGGSELSGARQGEWCGGAEVV